MQMQTAAQLSACQFLLRQFFLISPLDPVRGLMLPIFIIDAANCLKNACVLVLYNLTKLAVLLPLVEYRISSERSNPVPSTRFL